MDAILKRRKGECFEGDMKSDVEEIVTVNVGGTRPKKESSRGLFSGFRRSEVVSASCVR